MAGTIRVIYAVAPSFPATDQHPGAVRYQIGGFWVDAVGGQPTQAEVDAVLLIGKRSAIQIVQAEDFRTTDAVQATMASWPLAIQTLYTARFTVTAIDIGNADTRTWHATASAKRVNGGAILVGTPTALDNDADAGAGAWGLTADVSGNNFRVRVTGAAGRTISWSLVGEVVRARPDGLVD